MTFNIGLTALRTSQYGIDLISGNIANANTPGYHRRNIHLESLYYGFTDRHRGLQVGSGVQVNYIERVRNQVTEASLTNAISDASNVDQLLQIERQIESMFQPGEGSLNSRLDNLFGEITKLTSTPSEPTQRTAVVHQADQLASLFNRVSTQLFELKNAVRYQVTQEVGELNSRMETLTELTNSIEILQVNSNAYQELDQRDQLINEIAEQIQVGRHEHYRGGQSVAFGNSSIQFSTKAIQFETIQGSFAELEISLEGDDKPVELASGRIPALLEIYNVTIPAFEERLDEIASGFINFFDQIHATGVGVDGSFTRLQSNRHVDDISVPLSEAGASFPIEAGNLYISITDPDGNRSTESIFIDPDVDSLEDVATAISQIDNLRASVNSQTNDISVLSLPGYEFDFTGSLETLPRFNTYTGTSEPSFSGTFTGNFTDTISVEIDGSGTIGVSENLFAVVTASDGSQLGRFNIGLGYEAGTSLEILEGVNVEFSAGTVQDLDSFETLLVSEPDETGFLSSLGLNSFFRGDSAATIQVDESFKDNPNLLASGHSGEAADTSNLFKMIELQQVRILDDGRLSFSEYLNEISTDAGSRVQTHTQLSISFNNLQQRFEQERDAVSGVDLNEELVHLQQFQTSYEAAVQVLQTAETMIDELMAMVR